MKIYVGHSGNYDFENDLYKPLRDSRLNEEHEIFLPHESGNEDKDTKEIIGSCDLFIAEVSEASTGLGIEMGRADMQKARIVCIYKEGSKISGSLKFVCNDFLEYSDSNDMIEKISRYIEGLENNT